MLARLMVCGWTLATLTGCSLAPTGGPLARIDHELDRREAERPTGPPTFRLASYAAPQPDGAQPPARAEGESASVMEHAERLGPLPRLWDTIAMFL